MSVLCPCIQFRVSQVSVASQWPLEGCPGSQCHPHIICSAWALSAHKHSQFYCVGNSRATPLGANFRASESKASSSLECSAERSRKSTKLKLACEYRTAGLPVKSSPSEKGKVLIKREQCQMHLNIAEREGLRRSQSI